MTTEPLAVELKNLRLVLEECEDVHTCGEYELISPDKPFLQIVKFKVCLDGQEDPVGHIRLNIISPKHLASGYEEDFLDIMDAQSRELLELAAHVFNPIGELKDEMYVPELGKALAWGYDDAESLTEWPIVYIDELLIKEPWRNKGIGSWTVPKLFETEFVHKLRSRYLITWPTVLNNYYKDLPAPFAEWTAEDTEKYEATRQKVISFYCKVGFRRLATTQFFMMAKSSCHPSRLLRPEDDLPFEEEIPQTQDARLRFLLDM